MNKKELVDVVAADTGLTKEKVDLVLNALAVRSTQALKSGGETVLPGLGRLTVIKRAARTGRNPRTGQAVEIAETLAVKFRVASALKSAVN